MNGDCKLAENTPITPKFVRHLFLLQISMGGGGGCYSATYMVFVFTSTTQCGKTNTDINWAQGGGGGSEYEK